MSKGSNPRPLGVNKAVFDSNWNHIFNKDREQEMWEHKCKHDGLMLIQKGQECNWCGAKEND